MLKVYESALKTIDPVGIPHDLKYLGAFKSPFAIAAHDDAFEVDLSIPSDYLTDPYMR